MYSGIDFVINSDLLSQEVMNEKENPTPPDLSAIDTTHTSILYEDALENWSKGDIEGVFCTMSNEVCLFFVVNNLPRLIAKGKYEEALLNSYIGTRVNYSHWDFFVIKRLFDLADPKKLRAAGDPVPEGDTFTLYRGISGKKGKRRVNGYSWTSSLNKAKWFATRFEHLENPAVYKVTVPREWVLAFSNERQEAEYILKLPLPVRPRRLSLQLKETTSSEAV